MLELLLKNAGLREENLKTDSRQVKPGDVFFAVKGPVYDGHNYIKEVLEKDVSYVVCEHVIPGLSNEDIKKLVIVKSSREALGMSASYLFKKPSEHLSIYGVTGTNGKTTTVFLIDSILNAGANPAGFVSTVFTKTSGNIFSRSCMTTPDVVTLNRLLASMAASGKKSAVIEISSHALDQQRIYGIGLDAAVFTNITPEHLDYHKNMTGYLESKSKIFQNLKPKGRGVLNCDDALVIGLRKKIGLSRAITFGIKESSAQVRGINIELFPKGTDFDIIVENKEVVHIHTRLIGLHNVYNVLAASAALLSAGLDLDVIKKGIEKALPVPGRLDLIFSNAPFKVFIDYAHTPDALKNILECVRPMTFSKLVCVFGCGGDRDKTKRPVMGEIASGICDYVILTNDNPRRESPEAILTEIEKGMADKNKYSIIPERHRAIKKALSIAAKDDIVIIAGKGHEDYQIIGTRIIPFDDKKVSSSILEEMGYKIM